MGGNKFLPYIGEIMTYQPLQPIKLVAIDIDGTLLNRDKHITRRTRAAIYEARDAGITIVLATARRYENSMPFVEELGIALPLILCDGTLTMHYPEGSIITKHLFDPDIAQEVADTMVQHSVQPIVHHMTELGEETWSGPHDFDNAELLTYLNYYPNVKRLPYHTLCTGKPAPLRIVAFSSMEKINSLIPTIVKLDCAWYAAERGSYDSAEVVTMNKSCSKATALKALAHTYNISMDQVMTIGDGINDCEMIQAAGWGVAMGQAPTMLKTVANAVTGTNSEDGLAQAIEDYVLLRCERYAFSNSRSRMI
jgi:5-amino-6-(5-phospho-D-ribitylamino)uracil phosphatase